MSQLLTLHRAARLVGVSRAALQKKIKAGELPAFEGMISPKDLLRVYPQTRLEDNTVLERLAVIKDNAFANRVRERLMPDAQVLAARLTQLSREQAQTRAALDEYRKLIGELSERLTALAQGERAGVAEVRALRTWLGQELDQVARRAEELQPLAVRESFLRLMSAHVRLLPSREDFFLDGAETILDAGLRAGLALKYGCSNGTCGLCKARVLSGEVKTIRPHADLLTDSEKRQSYVLLCSTTAVTDVDIEAQTARGVRDIDEQHIQGHIKARDRHSDDMMVLYVRTPEDKRLRFLAGQSVILSLGQAASRELPVASCPCEDRELQFHVRRERGDAFSAYVFDSLKEMDEVTIHGPRGSFVLQESSRPIVFIACDGGFAPIKSLIEHAVAQDMAESLHLYWITPAQRDRYYHNLCRSWSDALDNFHYTPLTRAADESPEQAAQAVVARISDDHPDLKDRDIYLAGEPSRVRLASRLLVAAGALETQLYLGHVH